MLPFVFGHRSDKNGFSHTLYSTTFPITFGGNALGLTKYEIPIDSRITKWLEKYGLKIKGLSVLSSKRYYNKISDFIQSICEDIGEYPCVLDAVIFSSYDIEWDKEKLIW